MSYCMGAALNPTPTSLSTFRYRLSNLQQLFCRYAINVTTMYGRLEKMCFIVDLQ